jgi:hypothetical protein
MNERHDPLEAELRALRPHDLSPALKQDIAEEIIAEETTAEQTMAEQILVSKASVARRRRRLALVAGGAAACLAAVLFWWRGGQSIDPDRLVKQPAPAPQPAPPIEAIDALPTVLAYSRALAESPAEVDALLDKHAALGSQGDPEETQIRAFIRFDELPILRGEL